MSRADLLAAALAACLIVLQSPASQPRAAGRIDQTEKSDAPRLRLKSVADVGGHWWLVLEVLNPGDEPVTYVGYTPDSFAPPPQDATISPLYRLRLHGGGKWEDHDRCVWCGVGIGRLALPPKGKATFTVLVPKGKWEAVKVGLEWRSAGKKGDRSIAWIWPVTQAELEKAAKP
jgi:hypothetical protein